MSGFGHTPGANNEQTDEGETIMASRGNGKGRNCCREQNVREDRIQTEILPIIRELTDGELDDFVRIYRQIRGHLSKVHR